MTQTDLDHYQGYVKLASHAEEVQQNFEIPIKPKFESMQPKKPQMWIQNPNPDSESNCEIHVQGIDRHTTA